MDADLARTLGCSLCQAVTPSTVLLDCLHNCCQGCADKSESKLIKCGICKDKSSLIGRNTNRFVSERLKAHSSSIGERCCDVCSSKGFDQQAEHWCRECCQLLCDECVQEHKVHVKSHTKHIVALVEAFSELAMSTAAAQQCILHGERYSFYCKKCKAVRCSTCMKACLGSKHDLEHLEASQSVHVLKQQLRDLLGLLESKSSAITSAIKLPDDLHQARRADMDALDRNKAVALAALHRAYKAAADELDSMHDDIAARAFDAAEAAQLLDEKVHQATKYSKCMLDFGDTVMLLEQQQRVLSRLQSLVDEVSSLPECRTCISIRSSLPDKLDETCKSWIGVPKLQTAEVQPSGPSQQLDAEDSELRLGTISSCSIPMPAGCEDIAITTDGHLLLAAGEHGMLEYDESGRQLSSWIPANEARGGEEDMVCTVDELPDRRVAVGLRLACTVQLLKRIDGGRLSWQQDLWSIQLQGAPMRLSVHEQLMAVAEWPGWPQPGKLSLYSVKERRQLLRLKPGYTYSIRSVAVTATAVLTASAGQVQLSDGRWQHVVDSYSHIGQLLWRQSFDEPVSDLHWVQSFSEQVYDLHWVQAHSVVYLALPNSNRVTAIRAVDGQQLSDVLSSSQGLKKPLRLSVSRGRRTVLAVLHVDQKTVTVYPTLGSSGSK